MSATERKMEILVDDLKDVIHDIEGLLKGIPEDLNDEARKIRARLETTLESVRHRCYLLERKAIAGMRSADELAHEKPYAVAGVTFGLGILIGALIRGRL